MPGPARNESPSVLVIGEALIDVVEGSPEPGEHVGGSPANVALGIARLGQRVRLRTALGRDARGVRVVDHLASAGVNVEDESFVLERTPTASVTVEDDGAARYDFDIEWDIGAPIELRDAGIVHVGSLATFLEPGASAVTEFLWSDCRDVLVSFDPNIRPSLLDDGTSGAERRLRARFLDFAGLADIVKLSDEDAAWLYPGVSADGVVQQILEIDDVALVVLTHGAGGLTIATHAHRVHEPAAEVDVRDTIGAGDTVTAALLASLVGVADVTLQEIHHPRETLEQLSAEDLRHIARRCTVAAGVTISRPGADLPTLDDVEIAHL